MNCPVCSNRRSRLVKEQLPGYVEGHLYDIFECVSCDTQFAPISGHDKKLYSIIYSSKNLPGYERYRTYSKNVRNSKHPLKMLCRQESTYAVLPSYLAHIKPKKILEVGSGYGYLTYALNKSGYSAKGIDISSSAVKSAKKHFGDYYQNIDVENYKSNTKYDLIIATELIEHLRDPVEFIRSCAKLLSPDGRILVTTPNKNFVDGAIWQTDLPPVHIMYLSETSLRKIGEKVGLHSSLVNEKSITSSNENFLYRYLSSGKYRVHPHILDRKGKSLLSANEGYAHKLFYAIKPVIYLTPIKELSNWIFNIFRKEKPILCMEYTKD